MKMAKLGNEDNKGEIANISKLRNDKVLLGLVEEIFGYAKQVGLAPKAGTQQLPNNDWCCSFVLDFLPTLSKLGPFCNVKPPFTQDFINMMIGKKQYVPVDDFSLSGTIWQKSLGSSKTSPFMEKIRRQICPDVVEIEAKLIKMAVTRGETNNSDGGNVIVPKKDFGKMNRFGKLIVILPSGGADGNGVVLQVKHCDKLRTFQAPARKW